LGPQLKRGKKMNLIFVGLVIFIVCIFVIEMCFYAYRISGGAERRQIRRRLETVSSGMPVNKIPEILEKRVLSEIPSVNRLLSHIKVVERLERLVKQANVKHSLGFFILLSFLLASMGYLGTVLVRKNHVLGLMVAVPLGVTPLLYLRRKKKKRMRKLQNQLPDGLEMIARALRAGHAFTTGMRLTADEFDDPLGTEFSEALDEINFGVSVADALANLATRLDSPDIRYFVISVLIQRTTGGNLAEILENIARLIRERIKFQGKVRVLSAEGKLSAVILIALPFVIVLALSFLGRNYIYVLWAEPAGRIMAGVAMIMMIFGALIMKKIVTIEV
jgi:tight adherence protein B